MTFGWLVACAHTVVSPPSPLGATRPPVCASVCLGFPCKFLSWQEEKSVYWPLLAPAPCMHTLHLPATCWRFYIKCWLCSLTTATLVLVGAAELSPRVSSTLPMLSQCPGIPVMRKRDVTNGGLWQGGPQLSLFVSRKTNRFNKGGWRGGDLQAE